MSHYSRVTTVIKSRAALVQALVDMGFKQSDIRVSDQAQQLQGYQGDKREQKANVILPRKAVGGASNDIGFELTEDGTYVAHVSDYDRGNSSAQSKKSEYNKGTGSGYNQSWLDAMTMRYSRHALAEEAEENGMWIDEEIYVDGQLHISITDGT